MDGAGEDVYADPMTRATGYSPGPEPSMGWTQPRTCRVTAIACTRMTWARLFLVMLAADTALSPGPCSSSATGSSVYCLSNGRVSPSKHGALGAQCVCPPPAGFCCSIPVAKRCCSSWLPIVSSCSLQNEPCEEWEGKKADIFILRVTLKV